MGRDADSTTVPLRVDRPDEFGVQCFELFIGPELERRRAAGRLQPDFQLLAVQIVFDPEGGLTVRVNDEVNGHAEVALTREIGKDEPVTFDELARIESFTLTEDDPNAAHITLFRLRSGWVAFADLFYNATIAAEHEGAAAEFLETAADALDAMRLRAFVDNLHSAMELMATCELFAHGEQDALRGGRSVHRRLSSTYNRLGKLGRVEHRFVRLHNRVSSLRNPARYLTRPAELDPEEAAELLLTAREMQAALRERTSKRVPPAGKQ